VALLAAVHLASNASDNMAGESLYVDGGLTP
jgi:enoyl-[acyl-carrier-protein] reductase (NADH)